MLSVRVEQLAGDPTAGLSVTVLAGSLANIELGYDTGMR